MLGRKVHDRPLVYLDNAATTQKPQVVIDALDRYYGEYNSNVHRGVHRLSQEATEAFEAARVTVQRFLGAAASREIVFTRGTTESVNLVANAWGRSNVKAGDEILVTEMEHHSNIVPWQMLCEAVGATLKVLPMDDRGALRMDRLDTLLTERTRLVAVVHVSNALGTVNPVETLIERAHAVGAVVLVDGAQVDSAPAGGRPSRSTPTSTPSPATRSTAPWASACSTARPRCSRPCPPGRAAAT